MGLRDTSGNVLVEPSYSFIEEPGKRVNSKLFIAKKEGSFGLIDSVNHIELEFNYDHITRIKSGGAQWFMLRNGKNACFADPQGKVVLKCDFEEIVPNLFFNGELAIKIKLDGKYGLMSASGDTILRAEFEELPFQMDLHSNEHGTLLRYKEGDKWGIIREPGVVLTEPLFDYILDENDIIDKGLLLVEADGKYGLLATANGKLITEVNFDKIEIIGEGEFVAIARREGVWYKIDVNGNSIETEK